MSHDPRADKTHRGKASSTLKNSQFKNLKNVQNKPSPQCARVQTRLLSYLDGVLSERERASLQQHLDGCERCRQELALYQMSEQALSGALHAVPPAGDLRPAFYARLASETAPRSPRQLRVNWRLAVPALAACSLLAGWLTIPLTRQTPQIAARTDQETRIARIDKNEAKNASIANAPIDAHSENWGVRLSSPALPAERFARDLVTLPPVHTGMVSGIKRIRRNAGQPAETPPRPTALIVAGIERHRESASHHAFTKLSVSASTDRIVLGRKSDRRYNLGVDKEDSQEAAKLAYADSLDKSKKDKTDQSKLQKELDALERRKAQMATSFFAYDAPDKMPGLKTTTPPTNYALSLNKPMPGQPLQDSYAETSLSDATGRASALRGDNAEDSLASSTDNSVEDNGIAIQVRDSRRGFTSNLRLASRVQHRDGKQVLTIHVEDEDANASSDAYTPLPGEVRMEPK